MTFTLRILGYEEESKSLTMPIQTGILTLYTLKVQHPLSFREFIGNVALVIPS